METKEIASRLVAYCRKGEWEAAHKELYSNDVKSIEPYESPDYSKEVKGLAEVNKKIAKFNSTVEKVHHLEVSEPLIVGNSIAFSLTMDITIKGKGRMSSPELCVYEVKDGKIISEQFFV